MLTFQDWRRKAKRSREAQAVVSMMLFCGDGVSMDIGEAYEWLLKSMKDFDTAQSVFQQGCDRGQAGAMYAMYLLADLSLDSKEKRAWSHFLVEAAELEYVQAQTLLGIYLGSCLASMHGLDEDPKLAERWLLRAVENGSAQPFSHLFHLYRDMKPRKLKRAFEFILKAAQEEGMPSDMTYLAECYAKGEGTPKDLVAAAKWSYLSAVQYHEPPAFEDFESLCAKLTRAERRKAINGAKSWLRKDAKKAANFELKNPGLPWPESG